VDADRARLFAGQGAVAESVRWFGGPGQNPGPWEIPLELFLDRVQALARDCDRVVVCGTSFGAEAALLTGVHSSLVHTVIGFAPTDVVWAGVTPEGRVTSHWTLSGEAVPFVPFSEDWEPDGDPPSFVDLYRASRRDAQVTEEAAILVERIPHVVLVAGGGDLVWPSCEQAARICERRERHGLPTTVVTGDQAGHRTILPGEPAVEGGMRMARGGTPEADRRLGLAAWRQIQPLLRG
jgi:acetyl esterase/lipase